MQILFVRHATANPAGRGGDAARKLTDKGIQEARMLAGALEAMGVSADKVLTSPLVRAAQTAAILGQRMGAAVGETDLLGPGGDRDELRSVLKQLAAEGVQTVALVGHTPTLEQMIGELIAGSPAVGLSLSKAGAALVELADNARSAELRWLLRRSQLELMRT
jgi:phosphohistidine phosphatase